MLAPMLQTSSGLRIIFWGLVKRLDLDIYNIMLNNMQKVHHLSGWPEH